MRAALSLVCVILLAACAATGTSTPRPTAPAPVVQHAPIPAPGAAGRAALRQFVDSLADRPEFGNAHWGLLIVDPGRGETLYARNADKLFMPASNMKLVTGAVAVAQLGLDYRWATTLYARGAVREGVLLGDLVARGTGDPSVSAHMRGDAMTPLRALADSVKARGISRIRGRVAAAPSPFTDAPLGLGWDWDNLDDAYSAGVDALYFNEGFTEIVVRGGASAGDPVRAETRPATTYPKLIVRARTVARSAVARSPRAAIRVAQDSSRAGVLVDGTIAAGDSAVLELTFRDQAAAYTAALREALRARGIRVDEAVTDTTAQLDSVAAMQSPPLREILPYFEKPSQNQIGEILFKTIALARTGVGTADSAQQVVSRQVVAWGGRPEGMAIRDGSGLSRHDYLSPRTIVHVLEAARTFPEFKTFYDALPIAGVDGTIRNRMKGTAAQGNVHAKTGTLDKARSLSGYVTTADGRMLLFSALCNNYTVPTRRVDQVTDALSVYLASLRLEP